MHIHLLIDRIKTVGLPATGIQDIVDKINLTLDPAQEALTYQQVSFAMAYIRKHSAELGGTIPHCRRGPKNGEFRLQWLNVHRAGDTFVVGDGRYEQLLDGTISSLSTVGQMQANHGSAIEMGVGYVRSTILKRELRSWHSDMKYMADKALALANALREERAAA
jgi:hypothetical protein